MCALCRTRGVDTPATIVHHVHPHHGNYSSFWHGELASLCASCHDSDMQRLEGGGRVRGRVDADGWPIE